MISGLCRVRVRYSDTDGMAVAHHSRHVNWMEVGRVELMRSAGMSYAQLERDGVSLPLVGLQLRYQAAARFDDLVEIETTMDSFTRVRVAFTYTLQRVEDQVVLATGRTEHAAVDRQLHPVRLPDRLRDLLAADCAYPFSGEPC
jgi:acyl-CoA thioester hydrolase